VPQRPSFDSNQTAAQIVATVAGNDDHEVGSALSRTGFTDPSTKAATLSGGWKTRLAVACGDFDPLASHVVFSLTSISSVNGTLCARNRSRSVEAALLPAATGSVEPVQADPRSPGGVLDKAPPAT